MEKKIRKPHFKSEMAIIRTCKFCPEIIYTLGAVYVCKKCEVVHNVKMNVTVEEIRTMLTGWTK